MSKNNYIILYIDNTNNAAFSLGSRDNEMARVISEAADKISSLLVVTDVDFSLRDFNGNKVGKVFFSSDDALAQRNEGLADGSLRLFFGVDDAACANHPEKEVAKILREAASKIAVGEHDFPLYDSNGIKVGQSVFYPEPSLKNDDVIDMNAALDEDRVYMADDGYSGIADGEYRFVVTTPDFEPGYHQEEGDVWLVNAKGEIASGYEDASRVRETDFRALKADEKSQLRDVVNGHLSFEDYERQFEEEDLDLS